VKKLDVCLVSVEILLLSQPPNGNNNDYVNLYAFTRSETAEQAGGDNNNEYADISATPQSDSSHPKASSKQLLFQQTKPLGAKPIVPAKKWSLSEKNGVQKSDTTEKTAAVKPSLGRPNLTQQKMTKELTSKFSSRMPPADKQSEQFDDGLIYEVLEPLTNLSVQAEHQTTKSRRVSDDESLKTPLPPSAQQHRPTDQYAEVRLRTEPAAKKPPPSTKPKTYKLNQSVATPTERLTNPVKPFVDTERSLSSQSFISFTPGGKKQWRSASEVPAHLESLSVEQVAECMELLHVPQLAAYFRSEAVDGKLLVRVIDEDILMTDFNCSCIKAKQVVQFVKNGWRPNE